MGMDESMTKQETKEMMEQLEKSFFNCKNIGC